MAVEETVGHNCGIFGVYNVPHAAAKTFLGLFSLQHRGQESAGICISDGKEIRSHRSMGLVTECFDGPTLDNMPGHIAIGHVRYSTTGSSRQQNVQPLVADLAQGVTCVAHNGNLTNAKGLRKRYESLGSIFQTTTDSEIILHMLAHPSNNQHDNCLEHCLAQIKGAFSFLIMQKDCLIAARDPQGFRPLVIGKLSEEDQLASIGEGWVVASETCALDQIGAEFVRQVEPGEVVRFDTRGMHSSFFVEKDTQQKAHCMFEHVYFARPDSYIFGDNVHDVRIKLGQQLAREHPVEADVVFPVPDSGRSASIGYARESGIPLEMGFIRSHYVGRSFIKPQQIQREKAVQMKFNVLRQVVDGKRIVVLDDSVIRGTTFRSQVKLLRRAGAKEIHFRVTCPPTSFACYYGIDFPDREQLAAARFSSVEDIGKYLGVDTLGYLSVEGLLKAVSQPKENFCTACWTAKYPVKPDDNMDKFAMETGQPKC